jgi:hypothetical protein
MRDAFGHAHAVVVTRHLAAVLKVESSEQHFQHLLVAHHAVHNLAAAHSARADSGGGALHLLQKQTVAVVINIRAGNKSDQDVTFSHLKQQAPELTRQCARLSLSSTA